MSDIKSGVPFPSKRSANITSTLRLMNVGEFVPFARTSNPRARRNALYLAARRLGIKVTISECPPLESNPNPVNLFGVWRVE